MTRRTPPAQTGIEMRRHIILYIAILLGTGIVTPGCSDSGDERDGVAESKDIHTVRVWKAHKRDILQQIDAVGTIEPEEEVDISAEVSARVVEILKDEGMAVSKGEVVVVLDSERFRLEMEKIKADLKKAETELTVAEKDLRRKEILFGEGMIPEEAYEDALTRRDVAKATKESISALLAVARRDMEDSLVRAPFDGYISRRYISTGSYVKKGERLVKLLDIDPVKATCEIPEVYLARIREGDTVTLTADALPGRRFSGRVYMISPEVDPVDRTFVVKARIDNAEGLLKPGLSVHLEIVTGTRRDVFVVPEKGVLSEDGRYWVFVVSEQTARKRQVAVGERVDGGVVVTDGIREGEMVVVDGIYNLRDGQKVRVVR